MQQSTGSEGSHSTYIWFTALRHLLRRTHYSVPHSIGGQDTQSTGQCIYPAVAVDATTRPTGATESGPPTFNNLPRGATRTNSPNRAAVVSTPLNVLLSDAVCVHKYNSRGDAAMDMSVIWHINILAANKQRAPPCRRNGPPTCHNQTGR
jgi:hypothetical protein